MADELTIFNKKANGEALEAQETSVLEETIKSLETLKILYSPKLVTVFSEKIVLASGAYTPEDVVSESTSAGTSWGFGGMAKSNGGGGYITQGLITAQTTNIASWFSLFLFTRPPTCELQDAAANTAPLLADRHIYVGRIDFPACDDIGTGMSETIATPSTVGKLPMAFVCDGESADLYGVLAIRNGLDLADLTVLRITLTVEQY